MGNISMNPNKKPTYSIVLLTYHREQNLVDMTKKCIESIKKYSTDYELIVVDNGSSIKTEWECDTLIHIEKNRGVSYGWNTGIRQARGKYIAVVSDDVTVRNGWLEGLRQAIDMPHGGVSNIYVEHLPMDTGIKENYKWFSGACFMLKRETIDKVGYFDEEIFYPCNYEDWDYWLRVYKAGLRLYVNYDVSVRHKEGATVQAEDQKKDNPNRELFITKWGFNPDPIFTGNTHIEHYL